MKSKKTTLILIPALAIWGYIGITLYKSFYPEIPSEKFNSKQLVKAIKEKEVEDYRLVLNYEDPFLKQSKATIQPKPSVEVNQSKKSIQRPEEPQINWPDVKYLGYVKSEKGIKAITTINGLSSIVSENDTISAKTIVNRIFGDSIVLLNESQKRTFKRI